MLTSAPVFGPFAPFAMRGFVNFRSGGNVKIICFLCYPIALVLSPFSSTALLFSCSILLAFALDSSRKRRNLALVFRIDVSPISLQLVLGLVMVSSRSPSIPFGEMSVCVIPTGRDKEKSRRRKKKAHLVRPQLYLERLVFLMRSNSLKRCDCIALAAGFAF